MASIISQACWASKVKVTKLLPRAQSTFCPVTRKRVVIEMPRRVKEQPLIKANSAGNAKADKTKPIKIHCGAWGVAQVTTSANKLPGAERVRRKLSSIFQRPIMGNPLPRNPKIQGNNCQSPRAHRCSRDAATSVCEGNSSKNSISFTNAQRANTLSNKS